MQRNAPLAPHLDSVENVGFNGRNLIARKTRLALENCGGLMIWEAGQDCRLEPVSRNGQVHQVTCPTPEDSLLLAIEKEIRRENEKEL